MCRASSPLSRRSSGLPASSPPREASRALGLALDLADLADDD
jgi:hypothetical protein